MGDVINLNRLKKRNAREDAAKQADVNRARFGRTRSECTSEELRKIRAKNLLDQHRIEGEDAS